MEPTISLNSMLEFIGDEYELNNIPTVELENVLEEIHNVESSGGQKVPGQLTQVLFSQFLKPHYGKKDIEKIIRIKELIIKELRQRGVKPKY